jgi:hypothetical protein
MAAAQQRFAVTVREVERANRFLKHEGHEEYKEHEAEYAGRRPGLVL